MRIIMLKVQANTDGKQLIMSDSPSLPKPLPLSDFNLSPLAAFCMPLFAALCLVTTEPVLAAPGDIDDDGVPDYIDEDDDNDGISDVQEGFTAVDQLTNSSFEVFDPSLATQTFGTAPNRSFQFNQDDVPGWSTNSSDGAIEIWESNHNGSDPAPTPSFDGNAHVEINSTASVALFQEIATTPGETMVWTVWHRGRRGVDITQVKIGSSAVPIGNTPVTDTMSTDRTAWAQYGGEYLVPAGQTNTRISFENRVTAATNSAVGNFLDDLSFSRTSSVDTDGDDIPDHQDSDSDGDGIPDSTEGHDADSDGIPDTLPSGSDTDGDGIDDSYDADNGGTPAPEPDADQDSIPDFLDIDSDGDGALDSVEGSIDTDGDGTANYLDRDSDGDGIPDSREAFDADRNGVPDVQPTGTDSDGDGLDNAFDPDEGGTPAPTQDTDYDGMPDYIDTDSDADGLTDEDEKGTDPDAPTDTDNDGTPDYLEQDGVYIHTGLSRGCSIGEGQSGPADPLLALLIALAGGLLLAPAPLTSAQRLLIESSLVCYCCDWPTTGVGLVVIKLSRRLSAAAETLL